MGFSKPYIEDVCSTYTFNFFNYGFHLVHFNRYCRRIFSR